MHKVRAAEGLEERNGVQKMKQCFQLLSALALAAALVGGSSLGGASQADAQAPPAVPHTFYGNSPMLDGAVVPDGTLIVAIGDSGEIVASDAVENGTFVFMIDSDDTATITITIGDAEAAGPFDIEAGSLTEVTLDLTSGTAAPSTPPPPATTPPATTPPATLPTSGSGGLAGSGGGSGTALAIIVALVIGLSAIGAVRLLPTRN